MGRQSVSVGSRADAAEFRVDLLGRLGLGADAGDQDIESANRALVEFLEQAPHGVRSWATARISDVDEAFALLSGPEEDLISAAPVFANAPGAQEAAASQTPEAPVVPVAPFASPAPASGTSRRTQLAWVIAPLVVLAAGFGVYKMGEDAVPGISGETSNTQATEAAGAAKTTPVDQVKVADLTKKVTANPKDVASLQGLGDVYFASSDYKNAAVWEQKILDVDPKNQVALLALGAAQFNLGNAAEAKKQWLVAAGLYPNNAEVHYDLGFLYMSQTPPDKAKMTAEWKKVVAIDPNSQLAKTVVTHLNPSPAPSGTPSGHPTTK
jgi:tetratricopeptide (TPR) repeat protein